MKVHLFTLIVDRIADSADPDLLALYSLIYPIKDRVYQFVSDLITIDRQCLEH